MKIYIAGKITGDKSYKRKFKKVEKTLLRKGHCVMNPAWIIPGKEFSYEDYIYVSSAMQSVCDALLMIGDWKNSNGANQEHRNALDAGQRIYYDIREVPRCTPKEKQVG